jgi:hypothetical protein
VRRRSLAPRRPPAFTQMIRTASSCLTSAVLPAKT